MTTLGTTPTEGGDRNAVHVATLVVKSAYRIIPGQPLKFDTGENVGRMAPCEWHESIGIADPFIRKVVEPDTWFYMLLHPESVTTLKHHWEHPAITQETPPDDNADTRLFKRIADECGVSVDILMEAAEEYCQYGHSYHMGQHDSYNMVSEWNEFWMAIKRLHPDWKEPEGLWAPFSCAC